MSEYVRYPDSILTKFIFDESVIDPDKSYMLVCKTCGSDGKIVITDLTESGPIVSRLVCEGCGEEWDYDPDKEVISEDAESLTVRMGDTRE